MVGGGTWDHIPCETQIIYTLIHHTRHTTLWREREREKKRRREEKRKKEVKVEEIERVPWRAQNRLGEAIIETWGPWQRGKEL